MFHRISNTAARNLLYYKALLLIRRDANKGLLSLNAKPHYCCYIALLVQLVTSSLEQAGSWRSASKPACIGPNPNLLADNSPSSAFVPVFMNKQAISGKTAVLLQL